MQVSTANSVKVYNLSAGKSLPDWISERKRRTLLKNDVGKQVVNLISWPVLDPSMRYKFIPQNGTYWPANLSMLYLYMNL